MATRKYTQPETRVRIDCMKLKNRFPPDPKTLADKKRKKDLGHASSVSSYLNLVETNQFRWIERKIAEKLANYCNCKIEDFSCPEHEEHGRQVPASLPRVDSLLSGQPNATLGTGHESGAETPANAQSVQRTRIRDEICGELNQAPTAVEALSRKDGWPKTPEGVAAALLDQQDCKVLVEWFKDAHDYLAEILRKQPGREDAAKGQAALVTIAERLTPFHYRSAATFPIKTDAAEGEARVWGVEVKLEAVAEIIIAALCDRATSFKPKTHLNEHPSGDLRLPWLPESGDGDAFRDLKCRLMQMLKGAFSPTSQADDLREALWEYLDHCFVKPNRSPGPKNRAGTIKKMIKSVTVGNRSNYILFPRLEAQESRESVEKIFKEISQAVGGLICMGLYGNDDTGEREIELFGKLLAMLPVRPEQLSGKS